ncbi:DUF3558 domain-containing protein [Prescottella agglutinans]|uniref:DUF3558 domain-containing protein n=1 Tax=Prescottella agglutinans TaxID=1644129 RepID=A0A3S3BFN3_9NOCA|nr:DUF3558 domain-containing protein [Prescottella agglutinans]RVW10239.1 DUF3558 domain-containing protein [Prescottella agglutinans]
MPKKLVGALLAAAGLLLAGCGGAESEEASGDASVSTARGAAPFFGECGSVTDDEVAQAFGVPGFGTVVRNSVGCEWQLSAQDGQRSPHVSFSWYRGSPIGRERAGSELIGRPATDIEIDGNPGFVASLSSRLCELGVQFGDDFVHWSIAYAEAAPTADPCRAARRLAELTVERAAK